MLIVVDIDGTILDVSRRKKKAGKMPPKSDQKAFMRWLDKLQPTKELLKDRPYLGIHMLLDSLRGPITMVYLTGRSEKHHAATVEWLLAHKFPQGPLHMRRNDDERSARDYKEEKMKAFVKAMPKGTPVVVFDDDDQGDCSAMYRKHGYMHLKVMGDK